MMVRLHLNCPKDYLCRQFCLQRTSLEEELKSSLSAESGESTVIQWKVSMIAHLTAYRIPKIGLTGMATWIIQITVKRIALEPMNLIWSTTMASQIRNAQGSMMSAQHQMWPDWFGPLGSQRDRLKWFLWHSMQLKRGDIKERRKSRTECVNGSPALCSLRESFS